MKVPFSSLEQNESQIPPEPFFPSIPMGGDLKTTNTSFDTDEMNITLRRNANTAFGADNVRLMLEAVRETNPDDAAFLQSESKRLNVPVPVLEGLKNQYNYSSRELMYALHLPGLSDYLLKPYAAAVSKDDLISLGETVEKYERLRRAQVEKLPLHQRLFRQDSDTRSGIKEINLWDTVGDEESLTAYFNGGSSDRLAGLGNNQRQLARFLMSEHPQTPWKELKNRPEIRSELVLRGLADAYGGLWGMNVDPRGNPSENGFLRFGQDMGFMFDKGMQNMNLSTGLNNLAADGLLNESYAKLLQKGLERRQTAESAPDVPEGFFGKIPYMAAEMSGPLLETALVATVGNKAGAAASLGKLGLSGKALTKSGAAALWSKNHAGSLLSASEWYAQGRGDLYMSMRESGVDPETARAAATAGAVPYAGIEYLQFHWVTKGTGLEKLIGQKLLGKLGKVEASVSGKILAADTLEVVEQASKRSLLKSSSAFVSRALTAGAFESSEEAIQEGILISAEESAKAIDNVMRDTQIEHAPLWSSETQTGILERIWLSFADSIGPMTLVSVPGAFSASRRRARLFEYLNERKTKLSEKQRSGASLSATENSELELLQNRFDGIRDAVNRQAAAQGAFETVLDEQSQIAKADVFYQELEDVRATVQSTKTFARSPENISSLLESVNSRLGMESGTGVYIDTEDLAAVREKVSELFSMENQGSIDSEPLFIPYEKIFTLPDEQWKAVLPHLKSAPGALSARQAAFRKTLGTLRDAVQSVRNQYENANPLQGEIDRLTREVDALKRNISPAQRSAALALLETRYRRMQEQIGTEETLAKLRRVHIVQGRTEDSLSDSGTFNQKNEQGETLFGVAGKRLTVPEILNDKTIQSSDFILADDGTPDWGFISEEMVQNAPKDLGLESLPIRLAKGNQFGKHHGFGLAHFFAEHGSEMEKRGIDLSDYILTVFRKISEVYISKRKNGNIRLELVNNGKPQNIGVLELQKEKGYYSIVTAFPKAFDRYKLEGKKIWQYSAPTETGGKQQADALEPLSSNNVAGTAREAGDQIYNNIPQSVNPFKPKSNKNNEFLQDDSISISQEYNGIDSELKKEREIEKERVFTNQELKQIERYKNGIQKQIEKMKDSKGFYTESISYLEDIVANGTFKELAYAYDPYDFLGIDLGYDFDDTVYSYDPKIIEKAEIFLKNFPGIKVEYISSHEAYVRYNEKMALGYYIPSNKKIGIIVDNVSVNNIERIILHELIGHHGLRIVFGAQFNEFLDGVYKENQTEIDIFGDEDYYNILPNSIENKRILTEEYLSKKAEVEVKPLWWKEFLQKIKMLLRKIKYLKNIKVTDHEIEAALMRSTRLLKKSSFKNNNLSTDGKIELYQEISPDQKYISKPSEKNRYLRFLEENPGNAIVKYLWDNGYVVRRPSPSEGRQVLECWEKLPKALRGNRKHGYAIDVLHKILEDAGIINGNLIYASDLYDYFSESRQMAIKLWRDMKDKDKLDELESKAYDSFHNGKSSDILSSGFLYELKRNHPEGYFSFTRMGIPANLHFENGKWIGKIENGNSFEVSANQFIRIDKHSLRIARSGGNFAENGIPVTIPSEENRPWLKRGSITQNSEGYFIRIFERGDVSTLCHEFSHLFLLEMMEMNHTDIETVQTAGLKALPEILLNYRKRYEGHISPNHRLLLTDYQRFALENKLNPNSKETAKSFIQSKENLVSLFEISGLSEQDSDFAAFTRRELHEYFARGFERYLLQGESPSESLRSLFRKFARWLSQIYRTVLNLGITPSAELRSVFDRMLATESEIQAEYAKRNALIDSKIKSNKENVLSAGEKAITAAASKVREQRAAEYRKFRDSELLSSQMEVRSRREYAVYDDIRRQGGIDRIIAQETFSAETVQTLAELGLIAEDRGITDLDTLAENYTFTSPDAMIDAMLSATAFNIEVEKYIRDKWNSRPEENTAVNALLDESDALYAERSLALANDEDIRHPSEVPNPKSIHNDLKRLCDMTESELMTYARSEMMESSEGVGRLIDAVRYREEIVRWNERLRIALQQNDLKRAAEANFFVRLATAKLKISAEIKKETDAALKRAKNIVSFIYKEAAEKSTKIDYEFAAALLRSAGRLGFTSKDTDQFIRFALSNNTADRNFRTVKELLDTYYTDLYSDMSQTGMEGVSDFVSTMSKDPSSSYWSSHLLDENRDCEWKNLMLAELNEAVGFLKFLEQRAEMKAGLLFSGTYLEDESKAFQTISKGLKAKRRITHDNAYFPAFQKWMNHYFAEHDGLTILLKSAYGYGENAEKSLLFQKLSQAFNEKTRLELEAQKQLRPALDQLMKSGFRFQGDLKTDVPVPDILRQNRGGGWTYDRILNIAFYMGSYESTQRLENYGLSFNDCLKLVEPVLSEADWKAVQQIWKMFETVTRPALKATYERMYKGIHFDEIVPRPFPVQTSDGKTLTLEGGYFPIRYDKQLQSIAQSGVESHYDYQNDPFNPNDSKQRKPKTGSIYSRVSAIEDTTLFPDLNSNVLFRVLSEQITWATHAEIVSDLSRLFRNETFKKSVVSHLGIEKYLKLMPGLNYIAAGETYYHEAAHAPFNWIRNRAQKVLLSANPRTAFIQYTAIPGMIQTIGADTLFSGFKEMSARGVMDTVKEICDKSPAMRARWFNTDYAANYTKVVQNVETGKGKSLIGKRTRYYYGKAENLLTKGMMWPVLNLTDITMTAPAWWGCYRKGLELFNGDEKKSISYANEKIAEAQPVGRPMDKSYAEYSNGIYRLFNMFSSYTVRSGGVFSSRGRYLWRSWQSEKISGQEYAMYVANEGILVPLMTRAMLLLLWFRLPEDEDLKDAAWEILSVNASGMTIFRDAANFFQRKVTGSYGANFGSVQLAAFEDMLSDLIYIGKYAGTDDVRNEKAIMKGANLLSWLFGVPAKRLYNNTVKGWEEISEDNAAFSALFIPDPKYRNPTRKKE